MYRFKQTCHNVSNKCYTHFPYRICFEYYFGAVCHLMCKLHAAEKIDLFVEPENKNHMRKREKETEKIT